MQPLAPYLSGEKPAPASRMTDAQKCVRTNDIESVGDKSHLTFFEMLGSWSAGDYGKAEAIGFAHDFLTSKQGLALPKERLWVSVFAGSSGVVRDDEAAKEWQKLGIPAERITFLPEVDNWWSTGADGLCGPDTEVFYDLQWPKPVPTGQNPGNDPDKRFIEIWNTVFMSYEKKDGITHQLPVSNIDQGAGLERILSVINGQDIYETSCFKPCMDMIESKARQPEARSTRIVADHLRSSLFIMSEEPPIIPGPRDQSYVLRRLIRSTVRHGARMGLNDNAYDAGLRLYAADYANVYPEAAAQLDRKLAVFGEERAKFEKILARAPKVWESFTRAVKGPDVPPHAVFRMVAEQGIPIEVLDDLAAQKGMKIDHTAHQELMQAHQATSRVLKP
jgi:alanyl-tRNA synthetase